MFAVLILNKHCLGLSEFEYVYTQYVANMRKLEITRQVSSVNYASMITMKLFIFQRRILVSFVRNIWWWFRNFVNVIARYVLDWIWKFFGQISMHCSNLCMIFHALYKSPRDSHATNVTLFCIISQDILYSIRILRCYCMIYIEGIE